MRYWLSGMAIAVTSLTFTNICFSDTRLLHSWLSFLWFAEMIWYIWTLKTESPMASPVTSLDESIEATLGSPMVKLVTTCPPPAFAPWGLLEGPPSTLRVYFIWGVSKSLSGWSLKAGKTSILFSFVEVFWFWPLLYLNFSIYAVTP